MAGLTSDIHGEIKRSILSNHVQSNETRNLTRKPTPEPIDTSCILEQQFIFRLAGDYNLKHTNANKLGFSTFMF